MSPGSPGPWMFPMTSGREEERRREEAFKIFKRWEERIPRILKLKLTQSELLTRRLRRRRAGRARPSPRDLSRSGTRRSSSRMATRDLTRTYLDCRSRKRAWAQLQHVRCASHASPPERDHRIVVRTVGPNARGTSERSQRPQRFQERARVA